MALHCQACGTRFSFGEFATLPDVCHSCHRAGRKPSDRSKALVDARGERNVCRLMVVTGVIVSAIALLFDVNPDAALFSKWKVGFAGLAVLGGGLAKIRHANRRLKKLESDQPRACLVRRPALTIAPIRPVRVQPRGALTVS